MNFLNNIPLRWAMLGLSGYALLPWHDGWGAPALLQLAESPLLAGMVAALGLAAATSLLEHRGRLWQGRRLLWCALFGLTALLAHAFGWDAAATPPAEIMAETAPLLRHSLGLGAAITGFGLLMLLASALAYRGAFNHDPFLSSCVVGISALIVLFTFFPVGGALFTALQREDGRYALGLFVERMSEDKIWRLACLSVSQSCGVAWNTLFLALSTATCATLLGLAFAFVATRTGFRYKESLRTLTLLPLITPPFVIGLGLILLFGRSGIVNQFLEWQFQIKPSRWIYGYQGVLLAQVFAFTPIAFLVLIGVVEGVSPSMEEAAQTLRASRWQVFKTVSLPLMKPGLTNAFLVVFIESIADFGNPIVLGGSYGVLSTEIFFSIVGAQLNQGRAAALALILLSFGLTVFILQRQVLGQKSYATVSGKGDGGLFAPLPTPVRLSAYALVVPWVLLTLVVYLMAVIGSFVEFWGRDNTLTLRHYAKAFSVSIGDHGLLWTGTAWSSLWTTLELAGIAALLAALVGLLTAFVLTRQKFRGRTAFEFGSMLSYAVPGTVIGVSYILAFNTPPLELTGTALIIVLCMVFRNMSVGVRSGIAAMSQIDRNLDEASTTLGAGGLTTLRRVLLPLLKPALTAALIYGFVRAMTTVSAVIFLVSPEHDLATVYIINRVINSDYGVAIAYSAVLIVLMLATISLVRLLVGKRSIGQRGNAATPTAHPERTIAPVTRSA